jgi:hypothetical protein
MNQPNFSFSIKKSILELIGNLVIVDTLFLVIFSGISIFLETSQVRISLDRDTILLIDISTTLIFSLLQTIIILLVAYKWHNEELKITKAEIIYTHGFWKIYSETISMSEIMDITISKDVFQELLNIGRVTFQFHEKRMKISFNNIDKLSEQIGSLNALKSNIKKGHHKTPSIDKLIEGGESESVEFKSTLYYDLTTKQPNKVLTETIMKGIVGFMNNQGGNIIIGVDDAGKILGLVSDYENLRKKNSDGFEQYFNNMFIQMIGAEYRSNVKLIFHKIDDQDICVVKILTSSIPVFLKHNGTEEFFVRTGNTTNPLKSREMYNYTSLHW